MTNYFFTFLYANLFFFLLQLIYIISRESSYIDALTYPFSVYVELIKALLIQLILYSLLSVFQAKLLWGLKKYFPEKTDTTNWQFFIFLISTLAILSLNCYYFPLSKLSRIFLPEVPHSVIVIVLIGTLVFLAGLSLLTFLNYFKQYPGITSSFLAISILISFVPSPSIRLQENLHPNLIIIGIDSLSGDNVTKQHTPTIYHFLENSVHFEKTISPLARTYSAWTTILTGLYPLHHHARENLYPGDNVKSSASFAWNLQKKGYQTIFATDDRRFNNLGKEFGFQQIVGPRIGIADVLLGSFYDFPLSNLLINWKLSQWLLPYNYINRAGHFSYYPSSFNKALQHSINNISLHKPLFMAIHFTLPHWPYAWAASSPALVNNEYTLDDREVLYYQALEQVDMQVNEVLTNLRNKGILSNSLLIVLSDHGEVLYKKGSRKTDASLYQSKSPGPFETYLKEKLNNDLDKSAGHGSDLLSPGQFECVLGFQLYKNNTSIIASSAIPTMVSLLDIAPTIAQFFQFSLKTDGISLLATIKNPEKLPENRLFFLESGLAPNQILSEKKVIELAKFIFHVNPRNNLIEVKKNKFAAINGMKLYGAIQGNWLIALYPNDKKYITVILNLDTGQWTDENHSIFFKKSPSQMMLTQMKKFYYADLLNYDVLK